MPSGWMYKNIYILVFLILCNLSCSTQNSTKPSIDSFSLEGFQKLLGNEYPIKYLSKRNKNERIIVIEYQFEKNTPYQHYIIEVLLSSPGTILVASEYTDSYKFSLTKKSPKQHKAEFPTIGYRAQYTFLGAGPGGVAEQLIFTDTQKKYDVKIVSSHLLAEDMKAPSITLENIANYINQALLNEKNIGEGI